MSTNIKRVTKDDADALRNISIETFRDTFGSSNTEENLEELFNTAYSVEQLKTELDNKNTEFDFIYVQDQLAGYLKININDAQSEKMNNNYLEVERIYIRKSFKRHGLGSQLMNYAIKKAQNNHKSALWLGVWEHNPAAIKFYEHYGFKTFSEHIFVVGEDKQRDILMNKSI